MSNPNKPGKANRPNRDEGAKQGQSQFEPVEQSADAEIEEAQREDNKQRNSRTDTSREGDRDTMRAEGSGEEQEDDEDADENGLLASDDEGNEDEEDEESLGGRVLDGSGKSKRSSDRLRP